MAVIYADVLCTIHTTELIIGNGQKTYLNTSLSLTVDMALIKRPNLAGDLVNFMEY